MVRSESAASELFRYGGAVAVTAAALVVHFLLGPWLILVPYLPAYFAVLAAARFWGLGPSLAVLLGGGIGCTLLPPQVSAGRSLLFVAVAGAMIWIVEVFRRAHANAEHHARVSADRLARLEKEIEQRSQEERRSAQLRAIVESSEDSVISKDPAGLIQSWNRGAEQVFGYTAAEAIGKDVTMLLPPDRIHEERDIAERIRRGGRVKHFETLRLRKDGKPIYVSLMVSPIRGADGAIIGESQIARDITERKEFEEQMRQTQKLESLGVLAGGLAHDFNNLLTGIMGNASLALTELDSPEKTRGRLSEVLIGSERAAVLVRQMLAYAGKGRFLLERVELSAQVREVLPLLRASITKHVELRLELAAELPPLEGDRAQIQQLVLNLALNAIEAIENRPGTVTIATSHRGGGSERQAILIVSDTGVGMSDDVKARMFDPFFTTKFAGRGLGLAAVTGIIRSHRGTISVVSKPGSGTQITVVLPAVSGQIEAKIGSEQANLRGNGLVLVTDDEELVRNMARFTLERYGYTIESAENGKEAVEKFGAKATEFAAILLDVTIPVINGEDALQSIRRIRQDIPVVVSSGYTEAEAVQRFQALGVTAFLQKPYTATALARKIREAVRPRT